MKLHDLHEASIFEERELLNTKWKSPKQIQRWLRENGFKAYGRGAFSQVWTKPTYKRVVKISLYEDRCWNAYVNWTMNLTSNPHLPNIPWVTEYQGTRGRERTPQRFNIAIVEKLESLSPSNIFDTPDLAGLIEIFLSADLSPNLENAIYDRLESEGWDDPEIQGQRWLKKNRNNPFSKTLNRVQQIAEKSGCHYDFHDGNVMVRPRGKRLVVTDPLADLYNVPW